MSGLYQKAIDYLQTRARPRLLTTEEIHDEEPEIPEEDREAINAQIEHVLERSKMRIDEDTFKVEAERKGGFLPILVNVIAVMIVAGGFFAALYYFDQQEQEVSAKRQTITSAESRLLETMEEESEKRLSEKNSEISTIQRQLATMIAERQDIKNAAAESIREQEERMRATLEEQLEAERQRLAEGGVSDTELARRMADFESEIQSGFEAQLAEMKAQSDRALSEQENTLNELISEYERSLDSAETERNELAQELEARRAELESQLEGQQQEFDKQLKDIRDQQANEQFVLNQLLSFYRGIEADMEIGELESAGGRIAELRSYLDSIELSQLPLIQSRRQVEIFLVDSLDSLVEREIRSQSVDTAALVELAGLVTSVIALVEEGNALLEEGSYTEARAKYLSSIEKIPALKAGYDGILAIDERGRDVELETINRIIRGADASYLAGNYEEAIRGYSLAISSVTKESVFDEEMLDRISEAGYQLRRANDVEQLRSVRAELELAMEREKTLSEELAENILELSRRDELLAEKADELTRQSASDATDAVAFQETIDNLQTRIEDKEAENAELTASNVELAATNAELSSSVAELSSKNSELAVSNTELSSTSAELTASNTELSSNNAKLTASNAELSSTNAELTTSVDTLRSSLSTAEQEIRRLIPVENAAKERARLASKLADLGERYSVSETGSSEVSDLSLLETKLTLVQVLSSESVRNDYPDLLDKVNAYLTALVAGNASDVQIAVLSDLNDFIDALDGASSSAAVSFPTYSGDKQVLLFKEFLQKMAGLLGD